MCLINFTYSVISAGDVLSGFISWTYALYVLSGAGYGWCYGFLVFCDWIDTGILLHI